MNNNKFNSKNIFIITLIIISFILFVSNNNSKLEASSPSLKVEPGFTVEVGEEMLFDATDYLDDPSLVEGRFEWDFGDGYIMKFGDPYYYSADSGISVVHFYMKPGTFTVTLTVTDTEENRQTATTTVTVTGDAPMEGFELWHAPFHGRIAQYIYAQIPQSVYQNTANRLRISLTGDQGYAAVLVDRNNLKSEEKFLLKNSELPQGNYVLTAELLDAGDDVITYIREKFGKPYDGAPRVGINENNAICMEGEPFFPVTPWILSTRRVPKWSGKYINTLYAEGWYPKHNVRSWVNYLNHAGLNNLYVIGPERWDGKGPLHFERNSDISKLSDYVDQTRDHPALFMWMWDDEPNMGGRDQKVPPQVLSSWSYKCHQLDPHHPVATQLYGYSYLPYYPQDATGAYDYLNSAEQFGGKKHFTTDVTGFDIYPLDLRNHVSLNDPKRGVMDLYAEGIDQLSERNYNLIPMMSFVETQDVTASLGTPGPTPEQLRMEIWINVVHGVKAINWFHFFEPTPPENFAVMEEFLDQITRLTPFVLGSDSEKSVTDSADTKGNRVDTMMKEDEENIWIFAVRITEIEEVDAPPIEVSFSIDDVASGEVTVYDESRILNLMNGSFSDSFDPCAVHVYRIPK